ncbi:MAG TPA: hypothetical protein VFY87_27980 [Geminicoccaceae bacterium]|nr:hypothetical protein [Geminicoccaceae bacterium]
MIYPNTGQTPAQLDQDRAGAVVGGVRQRQDRRAYRRDARQRQAARSQQQAAFSQSFDACMAARGYTVQ